MEWRTGVAVLAALCQHLQGKLLHIRDLATSRLSLDYILCIFLDKWAAHDPMSLKKLVLIQGYGHESFFRYKVCRDMVISMVLRRETSLWPATIWIPCRRIFSAYSISRWRRVSRVARRLLRLMRLPSSPRSSESPCSLVIDKLEIVCTFAPTLVIIF